MACWACCGKGFQDFPYPPRLRCFDLAPTHPLYFLWWRRSRSKRFTMCISTEPAKFWKTSCTATSEDGPAPLLSPAPHRSCSCSCSRSCSRSCSCCCSCCCCCCCCRCCCRCCCHCCDCDYDYDCYDDEVDNHDDCYVVGAFDFFAVEYLSLWCSDARASIAFITLNSKRRPGVLPRK